MPRTTTKRMMLRAAFALALTASLAAPAALAQTNGAAADQPLMYHADPNAFTPLSRPVIVPPSAATGSASVQTLPGTSGPLFNQDLTVNPGTPASRTNGGALGPALVFHADPNAFTPLARPVIIPPRSTSESRFGLPAPAAAGAPDGDLRSAGVPIEPSTGVVVPAPRISRRDLLAGPSFRRGAAATRSVNDRAGSTRVAAPPTTVPNGVSEVVITNRQGRTRVVTR